MISDRLDEGLYKEALEALNYLKQDVHVWKSSGFDTVTKQVMRGSIESRIDGFDATVRHVSDIKTETTPSILTIVADIVSNTLYRHLKSVVDKESSPRLHGNLAINGFILRKQTAFIGDDYIKDALYNPLAHG